MDSILTSIKKMLGPSAEDTHFDPDIIMHINTVMMDLGQIGVGPDEGFAITGNTETWEDFIPEADMVKLEGVKSYIYLRVRLLFDPPINSAVTESINKQIDKLEWRLNVAAESIKAHKTEE